MSFFENPCRLAGLAAAGMVLLTACDGTRSPLEVMESQLVLHGGDAQVGEAGTTLPQPLTVLVTNLQGIPVRDVPVRWSFDGAGGVVDPELTASDAAGLAQTVLTLPPEAGMHRVTARIPEGSQEPVGFTATSLVDGAYSIALAEGETGVRGDTIQSPLPPYRVVVRDHLGEPVPEVRVAWRVQGGRYPRLSHTEAVTNAQGIAEVTHTLGVESGEEVVYGEASGLVGSPVAFRATVESGAPVVIGSPTWPPLPPLSLQSSQRTLSVGLRDRFLNPVAGFPVHFSVTDGTGTVSPSVVLTDLESGTASATHRLGSEEGEETVTATAGSMSWTFPTRIVSGLSTVRAWGPQAGFRPDEIAVPVGRTVGWLWSLDDDPYSYCYFFQVACEYHNVTFLDDPSEPVSSPTQGFGFHLRTFHEPGTYRFYCTVHGHGGAVVVLRPASS